MKQLKELVALAGRWLPEDKKTRIAWLLSLLLSVVLVLLPLVVRLDGTIHANWEQFLGRFHPLAVHLPIGLLVLIPILEVMGRYRPAFRETAGFIWGLAFAACLLALTLGFLLAYGGGTTGATVTRHMWGAIALSIGVLFCVLARPRWVSGEAPRIFPVALTCLLLVLVWTAHQGGALTHGSDYLTAYLPSPIKHWLRLSHVHADVAAGSFYAKHIDPILDANCVNCHGEAETKGGLRLDSYHELMKGGKDGPAIVPGKPDRSILFLRVTLPPSHKKFMPAEGKPPLTPEEIAWIKAWIEQGASATETTLAGVTIHDRAPDAPLDPVGDYSALMPKIRQMDKGQGAKLEQVSFKPSDGLVLNSVDIAPTFDDTQLAAFTQFAPYIVEVELGRTAVTNACFATLAKFTHLRAVHLEGTRVTGDGLSKLAVLPDLTYLNLSGTRVTAAAAAQLRALKKLRHIYLYNTPAQPATEQAPVPSVARSAE